MKVVVLFVALFSVNAIADVGVMPKSEINAAHVLCKEERAKLLRQQQEQAVREEVRQPAAQQARSAN